MASLPVVLLLAVCSRSSALQLQPSVLLEEAQDVSFHQTSDIDDTFDLSNDINVSGIFMDLNLTAATLDDVKTGASDLEQSIVEQEQITLRDITAQTAAYEQQLLAQQNENSELAKTNADIENTLDKLHASVSSLRGKAEDLSVETNALSAELRDIETNVETALELADLGVNASSQRLVGVKELDILSELAANDERAKHELELARFSQAPAVSLLGNFVVDENSETLEAPEELIQRLDATLGEAASTREANLMKLKEDFERLYAAGEENHTQLLQRQVALNMSVEETKLTQQKLMMAVKYLTEVKMELAQRISALRAFGAKALGGGDKNTLSSFLQEVPPDRTFENLTLRDAPKEVYRDVKTDVADLQDAISSQAEHDVQEIQNRKRELAQRLAEQQRRIEADERVNSVTQARISILQQTIGKLRAQAEELVTDNKALTDQLKVMQKNISNALEFVNDSVQDAVQRIHEDPHLEVLEELREEDQKELHLEELNDFAKSSSISMLISENDTAAVKALDEAVNLLNHSLQAAIVERDATFAKLDEAFDRAFAAGEDRHGEVLRKQEALNQTHASAVATKERLEEAVSSLTETKQTLEDKLNALRMFGSHRLGSGAPPESAALQPPTYNANSTAPRGAGDSHNRHFAEPLAPRDRDGKRPSEATHAVRP